MRLIFYNGKPQCELSGDQIDGAQSEWQTESSKLALYRISKKVAVSILGTPSEVFTVEPCAFDVKWSSLNAK